MVWSIGFVNRENGVKILFLLAIAQMLTGGGWVIDLALITCLLATRINQPLNWWHTYLPEKVSYLFAKLLPFSLIIYSIIALSMNLLSIFALSDGKLLEIMTILAALMFLPMISLILGAISYELQKDLN